MEHYLAASVVFGMSAVGVACSADLASCAVRGTANKKNLFLQMKF